MLRHPEAPWVEERSSNLLKLKKANTGIGQVIGYIAGKGKYLNLLGALRLRWGLKIIYISGFTDAERSNAEAFFPLEALVQFRYNGLTDSGMPMHARYYRKKK